MTDSESDSDYSDTDSEDRRCSCTCFECLIRRCTEDKRDGCSGIDICMYGDEPPIQRLLELRGENGPLFTQIIHWKDDMLSISWEANPSPVPIHNLPRVKRVWMNVGEAGRFRLTP
jgi:hypothetical protein